MKVAVTAYHNNLESEVDEMFGYATWFFIFDTETGEYQLVNNEDSYTLGYNEADAQATEKVSAYEVEAAIMGTCGPMAYKTLNRKGIKVFCVAQGKVREVVEKFKRGELEEALGPNVIEYWNIQSY
jgi:predicted Fe-Mo cluster-binding NifX family protein